MHYSAAIYHRAGAWQSESELTKTRALGADLLTSRPPLDFQMAPQSAPPPASKGVLGDIVDSVFTPGTNSGLIQATSYSFYALFLTLLGMLWLTGGNIHVWALFGLSVGLFASIKWCVQAADKADCADDASSSFLAGSWSRLRMSRSCTEWRGWRRRRRRRRARRWSRRMARRSELVKLRRSSGRSRNAW